MKRKLCFVFCIILLLSIVASPYYSAGKSTPKESVSVLSKGSHYEITIDYTSGASHRKIGEEYGEKVLKTVKNYEALADSYIAEITQYDFFYLTALERTKDIRKQLPEDYRDEIEGMASKLLGGDKNIRGDGKISLDELYLMNLLPDVGRVSQCSAFAVYGSRSEIKKTMSMRILDWYSGKDEQMTKIQAVTVYKNRYKSLCTIGYVGFWGVLSGFNDNKVFAAILDSSTGKTYSSESKRSYPFDLRYALENKKTINTIGDYMSSKARSYAYSHLIFLADSDTAKVLENNISSGANQIRALRTATSHLNSGIKWDISSAIGSVNSFLLKGNFDNHSSRIENTKRWEKMKSEVLKKGKTISFKELKEIAGFCNGNGPGSQQEGDLYNANTQQIILYIPRTNYLEVFFRPQTGGLPEVPVFENIKIAF